MVFCNINISAWQGPNSDSASDDGSDGKDAKFWNSPTHGGTAIRAIEDPVACNDPNCVLMAESHVVDVFMSRISRSYQHIHHRVNSKTTHYHRALRLTSQGQSKNSPALSYIEVEVSSKSTYKFMS